MVTFARMYSVMWLTSLI